MNIGFIGLGKMGGGIAANILKSGYHLTVYDIQKKSAKPLLDKGAYWSGTPKEISEASDIVFTSLPGPREVEEVALGKDGIIEGIHPGFIYVDLSTSSPELIRRIYQQFKEKKADVIDAPVSGGPEGAKSGVLSLMVGGDEEVFEKCKYIFKAFGNKITYTGGIGSGSICKIIHNCLAFITQTAVAECFITGVKAGVEPRALWQTVKEGAVGRGVIINRLLPETYFRGNFDKPVLTLHLGFKDVDLATSLGREFKVPMPIAETVRRDLVTALNKGWGDKDSCIALLLQENRAGGVEVRIPEAEVE
jgi:3-hydroxyisobutyrate dehydrogenase